MSGSRGSSRSLPGARTSGGASGSAGEIPSKKSTITGDVITFVYPLSSVQKCLTVILVLKTPITVRLKTTIIGTLEINTK